MVSPHLRPSKRIVLWVAATLAAVLLLYVATRLVAFAQLFGIFGNHAGVRISQVEVAVAHRDFVKDNGTDPRPAVIPKIIHQIFHNWDDPGNETLPPHWEAAKQTCVTLNPEWEHNLWTTEKSRDFLAEHFPWFLPTYDGYKFPIQRVDVMRYFLIRHYGGIYLDMDNGCAASLDPLTYYPAFTTDGGHGALSNNIMGGQRGHPYFQLLSESLMAWDWNWVLPYVIISYDSGQWFVTAMWERYHSLFVPASPKDVARDPSATGSVRGFDGHGWAPLHHVMMDSRKGADPWVFFTQVNGGTWTNWDSHFFDWLGRNIILVIAGVCVLLGGLIWSCVWCMRRRRARAVAGYAKLAIVEDAMA